MRRSRKSAASWKPYGREASEARARAEEEEREARRERARELSELRATLTTELRDTRKELEALLSEARDAKRRHDTRVDELDARLTRRIEEVAKPLLERSKETVEPEETREVPLTPGARVMVADFGVEGELTRVVSETEAEVRVHDKKLRLALSGARAAAESARRPGQGLTAAVDDVVRDQVHAERAQRHRLHRGRGTVAGRQVPRRRLSGRPP